MVGEGGKMTPTLGRCRKFKELGFPQEGDKMRTIEILHPDTIHANAVAHGFYEEERAIPEILCLIHSEVSEALESWRKGDEENFNEEIADIVIRVLDLCGYKNIDIAGRVLCKHLKNVKREYRHGKRI